MPSQNKIVCSKCKAEKGTTNVRLNKLIKQYGSQDKLEKQYVCRSCKSGNTGIKNPAVGKTPKKSKLPTSKVICSKCKCKFGTTKTRLAKLIAQYGSLEEVHKTYVCRKCRKEHNVDKRGRVKPPKRKRKVKPTSNWERDKNGEIILPKWMSNFRPRERRRLTPEELGKSTACWRPDIWSENGRACNGPVKCCQHFGKISCGSTQVATKEKQAKVKVKKTKKTKTRKKNKK